MSSPVVRLQAAAERDLEQLAEWLAREADPHTAARVVAAARRTFDVLAETPRLGPPAEAKAKRLANARRWQVQGFPNYLIFYQPSPHGGVTILRVKHAAQDWKRR